MEKGGGDKKYSICTQTGGSAILSMKTGKDYFSKPKALPETIKIIIFTSKKYITMI